MTADARETGAEELARMVSGALYGRAQSFRSRAGLRCWAGPANAVSRALMRAEAKELDELAALLWTPAGKGVIDRLADVVKAAAL